MKPQPRSSNGLRSRHPGVGVRTSLRVLLYRCMPTSPRSPTPQLLVSENTARAAGRSWRRRSRTTRRARSWTRCILRASESTVTACDVRCSAVLLLQLARTSAQQVQQTTEHAKELVKLPDNCFPAVWDQLQFPTPPGSIFVFVAHRYRRYLFLNSFIN